VLSLLLEIWQSLRKGSFGPLIGLVVTGIIALIVIDAFDLFE
jgi:hypothetical protein